MLKKYGVMTHLCWACCFLNINRFFFKASLMMTVKHHTAASDLLASEGLYCAAVL